MGKDIGFLPGDIEEKLKPWMQPVRDNLDFLVGSPAGRVKGKKDLQSLFDLGMIESNHSPASAAGACRTST
jgi:PhoH-like ATPase